MVKTKQFRFVEMNGVRWKEFLWEPDRGDSDLDVPEWRMDDETPKYKTIPNFMPLQGLQARAN